ncbi:hypothetical protein MGU_11477 [Metarhizium guizhouense ARSEF 977]|uniref:Uncharacterized protein n=1 Tax=Metarhizium guizhouense (strain ARSEF 977) TaxID=1276136 RepID=A0A0B4GUG9_METGA|nr:hypothetical protein MGU_11477 [Metarhizium guizhouense ARSEF 977]
MAAKVQIPGLNRGLKEADMEQSRQLYNSLPSDEAQPDVEDLLQQLAEIFVRNNAHKVFGVHLVHGHLQLPENNILFGEETTPRCRWTKPTATNSLQLDRLQGHTFILTDNGFHPYQYQSGQYPDMGQVGDTFLSELADFLNANALSRVIALELLDSPLPEAMMELVLGDHGTMMIEPSRLLGCTPFRRTGWAFSEQDGKPRVCQDGKQFHGTTPKGHVIATTPRDIIETSSHALHLLKAIGLLS